MLKKIAKGVILVSTLTIVLLVGNAAWQVFEARNSDILILPINVYGKDNEVKDLTSRLISELNSIRETLKPIERKSRVHYSPQYAGLDGFGFEAKSIKTPKIAINTQVFDPLIFPTEKYIAKILGRFGELNLLSGSLYIEEDYEYEAKIGTGKQRLHVMQSNLKLATRELAYKIVATELGTNWKALESYVKSIKELKKFEESGEYTALSSAEKNVSEAVKHSYSSEWVNAKLLQAAIKTLSGRVMRSEKDNYKYEIAANLYKRVQSVTTKNDPLNYIAELGWLNNQILYLSRFYRKPSCQTDKERFFDEYQKFTNSNNTIWDSTRFQYLTELTKGKFLTTFEYIDKKCGDLLIGQQFNAEEAVEHLFNAQINSHDVEANFTLATFYLKTAQKALETGDVKMAEVIYQQGLKYGESLLNKNKKNLRFVDKHFKFFRGTLGKARWKLAKILKDDAVNNIKESKRHFNSMVEFLPNTWQEAWALSRIADLEFASGNYKEAINEIFKALKVEKMLDNSTIKTRQDDSLRGESKVKSLPKESSVLLNLIMQITNDKKSLKRHLNSHYDKDSVVGNLLLATHYFRECESSIAKKMIEQAKKLINNSNRWFSKPSSTHISEFMSLSNPKTNCKN